MSEECWTLPWPVLDPGQGSNNGKMQVNVWVNINLFTGDLNRSLDLVAGWRRMLPPHTHLSEID